MIYNYVYYANINRIQLFLYILIIILIMLITLLIEIILHKAKLFGKVMPKMRELIYQVYTMQRHTFIYVSIRLFFNIRISVITEQTRT